MSNLRWDYLHVKLLKDSHREKSDSLTHLRRTFPRRTLPRRTLPREIFPRPDISPMDTSPTRHIPDGHFPNQTHPRRTLPRPDTSPTDISPTRHIPDGHFPDQTHPRRTLARPDISPTDISSTELCNATKKNVRLSTIKTQYFISFILFLSRKNFFIKVARFRSATLRKLNSFTGIFHRFWTQVQLYSL